MTIPLDIVTRHAELEPEVRTRIEKLAAKLGTFDDRLQSLRVVVDAPQKSAIGRVMNYQVAIHLDLPGQDLVVRRQVHPDLDTAIQEAFLAAGRRLQDAAHRRRGEVKRHGPPEPTGRAVVRPQGSIASAAVRRAPDPKARGGTKAGRNR
jgi:ribosome-associated translation inhibitor RaiA